MSSASKNIPRNNTPIELVAVIAIGAILAAILFPVFVKTRAMFLLIMSREMLLMSGAKKQAIIVPQSKAQDTATRIQAINNKPNFPNRKSNTNLASAGQHSYHSLASASSQNT